MGRRIGVPDSPRRALYVGDGLRYGGLAQPASGSQLEFFDWGIRLQGGAISRRFGACYEYRYGELAGAGLAGKLIRRGVVFRADSPPQPPVFLTVDGKEILDRLERQGVPVDCDPGPLLTGPFSLAGAGSRGFRISFISVAGTLLLLVAITQIIPGMIGAQENFRTLRGDLARVHLPSGYRLTAVHTAGTDCAHQGCSLTQTWKWVPGRGRTKSGACADVYQAMNSAYPGAEANAPIPADVACDYFTVIDSLLHPGQGKRLVDAIVQTGGANTSGGFLVKLVASYS